jgi:hypothetical protein
MDNLFVKRFFLIVSIVAIVAVLALFIIRYKDIPDQGQPVPAPEPFVPQDKPSKPVEQPGAGDAEPISGTITDAIPITPDISSVPPPLIYKRFEGMLDNIVDYEKLEQDEPYNTLLKYVNSLTAEMITQKVNSGIPYSELMKNPKQHRGEIVRARGVILYLNTYKLQTNPARVEIYYDGMIGEPSKNEVYRFHVIERPEAFKTFDEYRSNADMAMVEGAFLKVIKYELAPTVQLITKKVYNDAPLIIGRKLVKIVPTKSKAIKQFEYLIGIGLIVGLAVIGLIVFFSSTGGKKKEYKLRK